MPVGGFAPAVIKEKAVMATLQASKQWSASTAQTRIRQASRERPTPDVQDEPAVESYAEPTIVGANTARVYYGRLSELEQRQLLLQTVTTYGGWHLVSVQHRPESDVLVAYLVRQYDNDDPIVAIREGRAMQIIMDAVGDLKVQHPRRRREGFVRRLLRKLGFASTERTPGQYPTAR
jgi:hypothetical protein